MFVLKVLEQLSATDEAIVSCFSPFYLIIEVELFLFYFLCEVGHLCGLPQFFADFVVHCSGLLFDAVLDVV